MKVHAALAAGFALLFAGSGHGRQRRRLHPDQLPHRQRRAPARPRSGRLVDAGRRLPHRRPGTGAGLSSQGAVALSDDGRVLVAVDAGSNDIASFRVGRRGHLTLVDRQPSGGVTPVSVDIADGSVYVLNAGGTPNVTGVRPRRLRPAARPRHRADRGRGRRRAGLGRPRRPRPRRHRRGSNRIETLPLRFGRIGAPVVTASSGAVPFGFAFSPRGDLIVSEAGASTVSSYRLNGNGTARVITASLPSARAPRAGSP